MLKRAMHVRCIKWVSSLSKDLPFCIGRWGMVQSMEMACGYALSRLATFAVDDVMGLKAQAELSEGFCLMPNV